jgi:hypothetical protein
MFHKIVAPLATFYTLLLIPSAMPSKQRRLDVIALCVWKNLLSLFTIAKLLFEIRLYIYYATCVAAHAGDSIAACV